MTREYTIGEAAQLLKVSRDALRFYERKGLVAPIKKSNGYRYYSEDQISILMDIIFLRKIQCGIQDIQTMYENGNPEQWHEFLALRIQEEKERIRMHQQLLNQLAISRKNSEKMLHSYGRYALAPMPKTYILSEPVKNYSQARNQWFLAAEEDRGLEHCYIHEQFQMEEGSRSQYSCYLVLEEFAVKKLKLERSTRDCPTFQYDTCVHTVCACHSTSPDKRAVLEMMKWAGEQGISLTGEVHAHYLWNYQREGRLVKSFVEMYMPVNVLPESGHA